MLEPVRLCVVLTRTRFVNGQVAGVIRVSVPFRIDRRDVLGGLIHEYGWAA
jgi:hypothetical protein